MRLRRSGGACLKRIVGIVLLLTAVALGAASAAGSFLVFARWTASIPFLETLALLAFLLVTGGVAWAASGLVTARHREWLAAGTVAAGLVLVVSAALTGIDAHEQLAAAE